MLDSARALFAARGVRAVSVREVAAAAGVNHGLVHRHFGSKEAILRAVLDDSAREIATVERGGPDGEPDWAALFDSLTTQEVYWRIVARLLLDGEDPKELQSEFPALRLLVAAYETMQRRGTLDPVFDPRIVAAGVAGLVLGWWVFEPFLTTGTGLDPHRPVSNRQQLLDTLLHLLGRMAPNPRA